MRHILWSGPRESDIAGLAPLFCASTTIYGSNQGNNRAYSKDIRRRINHNRHGSVPDDYGDKYVAEWIERYPDLSIFFYDPRYSRFLSSRYQDKVIGCNDIALLELLDSKSDMRRIAARHIPIVPFQQVTDPAQLRSAMPKIEDGARYVLQENRASGGYGTHIISKDNVDTVLASCDAGGGLLLSDYIENSVSVNIHCVLYEDQTVILPGTIQLVREVNHKAVYLGADFIAYQEIASEAREAVGLCGERLCNILRDMGYRGVLGIDFLLTQGQPMFLEVNARFQASTILLNKALMEHGFPSVQEMHLAAFGILGRDQIDELDTLRVPYSMAAYTAETWKKDLDLVKQPWPDEVVDIALDGYQPAEAVSEGAYLFRVIFQTNLCDIDPDGALRIYENLFDIEDHFADNIRNRDPLYVKISLLNQGVRFTERASQFLDKLGEVRKAVFSAVDLTVLDGLQINSPNDTKLVAFSPWKIDLSGNTLTLFYHDTAISPVSLDMKDPYSEHYTQSGIPFKNVSFWATDRMRIHHTISCVFKQCGNGCRFCEVVPQKAACRIRDICEVIDFYLDNADTFRHFLIGGGSEPPEQEAAHITELVRHIRARSDKPIYLMCLPPKEPDILQAWYDAGVNEIAFNLELFDRSLAEQYMPGKGKLPLLQYLGALKAATGLWGKTGNVRTLFIAGLEKKESLLQGIETVAGLWVMPILSVFRALGNTETENVVPPSNEWLLELFTEGERICTAHGLHLGPSCPACQNNTLSLPFN